MVYAIALPVHELLIVKPGKHASHGFGLFFLPDVNGADGVIRTDNNSNKPEWKPSGPWNAKLPKHGSQNGVEIKHIEVTRDKVVINKHYVYDRAGFIALKAPRATTDEMIADVIGQPLTLKDASRAILANLAQAAK